MSYNLAMLTVKKDFSLQKHNAFKLDIEAKEYFVIKNVKDLKNIQQNDFVKSGNFIVLGEGTNTLFTKNYPGLVLKMEIKGKQIVDESSNTITLEIGAGEDWIKLVDYAVKNNWGGIENLSYIPGKIGAAPVQNIAAYGQNFDEVFNSLKAYDLETGKVTEFNKNECKFGYRTSIFKTHNYKKYVIISVKITLNKNPKINTEYHSRYESLLGELSKFSKPPYTIQDVHKAVVSIRKRKLPDWHKVGTAGSFFVNPVISKEKLKELQKNVPEVQYYPVNKLTYPNPNDPKFKYSDHVKVAAGWLLEELGWKGKRMGPVGTSPNQALVVINYDNASADNVVQFTNKMRQDFFDKYGIKLESEVNII